MRLELAMVTSNFPNVRSCAGLRPRFCNRCRGSSARGIMHQRRSHVDFFSRLGRSKEPQCLQNEQASRILSKQKASKQKISSMRSSKALYRTFAKQPPV